MAYARSPLSLSVALAVLLITAALAFWWPASSWLSYRSVTVDNVHLGAPITMTADREIVRPFLGSWTATVKEWRGEWQSRGCSGRGTADYTPDSRLPRDLNLSWWMGPVCSTLPVGKYKLITTWVINLPGPMPDKRVTIESNVFEIMP